MKKASKPSSGTSVPSIEGYIASLPAERQEAMRTLRKLIRKHLPKGYAEGMGYGMICYTVPLKTYPDTYNGQPLCYLSLSAAKNHFSLSAMNVYGDRALEGKLKAGFAKAGKKLDMGKACIRFRTLDDLPLPVIAETIAATSVKQFIAIYEKYRPSSPKSRR